jgi:hypothetical protein
MAITHAKPGEIVNVRPLGAALAETKTTTLFKTENVESVRMVMQVGKEISEHEAPGEIEELSAGQLLYLAAEEPQSYCRKLCS